MKLLAWGFALFAMALSCVDAAQAADPDELNLGRMTKGYSYYNRPGATMAKHNEDVLACLADAANMRSFREQLGGGSLGLIGGLIDGALADAANRGVVAASLENCMVVRGWRVVRVDEAEGITLSKLPAAELVAKLEPWIGAETPHGRVTRVWRNDAALAAVNHFSLNAGHTKNGQLSLLAQATTVSATVRADKKAAAAAPKPARVKLDPRWPKGRLKPATLDTVPADAAILIVNVNGVSMRQGNGFTFGRIGADPLVAPSTVDRAPDLLWSLVGAIAASADGKFLAFAVPAGRWRVQSMVGGALQLSFCLGAPAFDVKPGEVVYAGELNLKQEKLFPKLDLAPVKAWMAGAKATERLRPADYVNGSRVPCSEANSIYALEFEGLPFEQGYAVGSQVPPL